MKKQNPTKETLEIIFRVCLLVLRQRLQTFPLLAVPERRMSQLPKIAMLFKQQILRSRQK
ncbi:MAG: hypothetical protein GY755_21060 [Chloroflexi bacterium]|nr:hypothetical protein [Chloroflexota bacterium]